MHLSDITQKFKDESLLTSKDIDNLLKIIPKEAQGNPYLGFKLMLQQQQQQQSPIPLPLKDIMLRLATKYLYKEKRRGRVIDSVANFHIRNGARMYRVNLNADLSKIRIKESFGIMVNYEYVLEDIESNNRDYILDGKVKASEQFLQNVY
jgi:malonyl-CoA decarboxylase